MNSPDDIRRRLKAHGTKRSSLQTRLRQANDEAKPLAVEAVAAGLDIAEVARLLKVTRQTIYTWTQNREQS